MYVFCINCSTCSSLHVSDCKRAQRKVLNKMSEISQTFVRVIFVFVSGQKQQSVDQFLSRLPQSVIKDGKIIDVRSGVANVIKVCNEKGMASLFVCLLYVENINTVLKTSL